MTHGTNAIDYITFDPNTNTNGITAAWANRQQPNNQQAGVQHLNVDVTYPGISAAKRVPVTVNVYQFEFPQTTYTTTVGGTLASGTQASGYAHMQNATGLPTDGFTYKWNRDTTGTNDANWAAMNKPNTAQVVNAKYDVIYNGHPFATSLPAKFVVKMCNQRNQPLLNRRQEQLRLHLGQTKQSILMLVMLRHMLTN